MYFSKSMLESRVEGAREWGYFTFNLAIRYRSFLGRQFDMASVITLLERLIFHTSTDTCTCSAIEKPVCVS